MYGVYNGQTLCFADFTYLITMTSNATIARRLSSVSAAILTAFLLTACDIDGGDNLPRVPDQGLFMLADVNRHEGDDSAQVAAAVFNNGEPVNLVQRGIANGECAIKIDQNTLSHPTIPSSDGLRLLFVSALAT